MSADLVRETSRAITAERYLQDCYRRLKYRVNNPKINAVLHDLLLMEEMNEVLLRSLSKRLGV